KLGNSPLIFTSRRRSPYSLVKERAQCSARTPKKKSPRGAEPRSKNASAARGRGLSEFLRFSIRNRAPAKFGIRRGLAGLRTLITRPAVATDRLDGGPPARPKANAVLRLMQILQPPTVGFEQVASGDHPDDSARVGARDDRQPADVVVDHVIGRLAQRAVVV